MSIVLVCNRQPKHLHALDNLQKKALCHKPMIYRLKQFIWDQK